MNLPRRNRKSAVRRRLPALLPACLIGLLACTSESAPPAGAAPGAGSPPSTGGPPPIRVFTTEVATMRTSRDVTAVGSLRSPKTTVVAADTSGILVELDAPEGQPIRQGRRLARIDDAEARASLRVAEARLANAKSAYQRAEPLVRDGIAAQQRLDDVAAELETAEGLLEEAKTRLAKTVVQAPFSGLVGIQTAQQGQYLGVGDPIVELTQLDPLELLFAVPEEQAAQVRLGQEVDARVGRCGQAFRAVVQARNPGLDAGTRSLLVQARVANPDRSLLPGMSARVRLKVGEETSSLVIPREGLVAQGVGYVAWAVGPDGAASPRPVTPGRFLPDVVEVVSGLQAGEQIVVAGHQKLRPGALVSAEAWKPTENPNLARGAGTNGEDCFAPPDTVREATQEPSS